MSDERLNISNKVRSLIISERKKDGLTAQQLSLMCGKNKYWLSNIERCKTTSIDKEDMKTLMSILLKTEDERLINEEIERLKEDETVYQEQYANEYFEAKYNFQNHAKELKRQLNHAHKKMIDMIDRIDYTDENSIMRYESCITTLIKLLSTDEGYLVFEKLFRYPLQSLDPKALKQITDDLKENLLLEYEVYKDDVIDEYALRLKFIDNDLFD